MLYDTICEIWPQYRKRPQSEVEKRFVSRYPTTGDYNELLAGPLFSRGGPDPLEIFIK
jgi:hypothetical protein